MKPSSVYAIKRTISAYAPMLFSAIRHSRRAIHRWHNVRLQAALKPSKEIFIRNFNFVVQEGPFAGLKFPYENIESAYLPQMIGSYEVETHGFIEDAIQRSPEIIIDVGCDAGYVAVGLALRAPAATVHAFDIRPQAQIKCREIATINSVENRIIIDGECKPERLDALCGKRALVFCDCEGYEIELLDLDKAPHLKYADIIVELHDFMRTDVAITPTILSRFDKTHNIAVASVTPRLPGEFACLSILPNQARAQAVHEDRVQYQQWAYLKSKSW